MPALEVINSVFAVIVSFVAASMVIVCVASFTVPFNYTRSHISMVMTILFDHVTN